MKKLVLIFLAVMAIASCRENPFYGEWKTPYGVPPFDKIQVSDYLPALKKGIEEKKAEIQKIADNPAAPTFENTVDAYELSGRLLSRVTGVMYNLAESNSSPEFEKVMEEVAPIMSAFNDEVFMNKKLFERIKTLYNGDQSKYNREQQMVLKKLYQEFTLSGVDLSTENQNRLKEINSKLALEEQKFGNNLLAENNAFQKEFGFPISNYTTAMTDTSDRALREKMFLAYSNRCNHNGKYDNKQVCLDILKLRAEKAQLLGFKNFAEYQLSDKMAKKPEIVDAFLAKIMEAATKKAKAEVVEMQKVMDDDIKAGKLPKGSVIQPWDWFYYAEKVRKAQYDLDESLTKPYFKLENVRDGAFAAAKKLYGINVEPISGLPVYHEGVETFKVTDSDGSLLGIFYADYLPRDSKRGGAWMDNFRLQYVDKNGKDVRPIIVNVCNLSLPTKTEPSLLTVREVETVFHEFGHALHGFLTKCHYPDVSGANVARDFVETFSQFNENWAFQPEILALYAKNYKTGEMIPDSLVTKIRKAEKFNQGFMTSELCAASILDMKWHELTLSELQKVTVPGFEEKVCKDMGLIKEIIPRYRTTYFAHIFNGGYSSGYYSYLWSEVLDKEAFEYFVTHGLYNPEVAKKFRRTFLERGGSEEPMTLYVEFTGAEPNPEALIKARGLE